MEYQFAATEEKWRLKWSEEGTFAASNQSEKPRFYVLDMFPYPSGSGLHVGHPLGYIASDIYARFKRHQGYNVLHPMGYDAFGLPAEQYAIQTGQHPALTTEENIKRYREQLDQIGFSFDWSRQVKTSDPSFYRWTQWIFIQLFHSWYNKATDKAEPMETLILTFERSGNAGVNAACEATPIFSAAEWKSFDLERQRQILLNYRIAYRAETVVNWCPALGTVLANDEVVNGVSERGGHPVEQKKMMQWSLRITAYAQRLLDGLGALEWSDSIKQIQENWIGRSQGAEIRFELEGREEGLRVFTTRPDTIFGVTFMVLAPEHPLVDVLCTAEQREAIDQYLAFCASRSERERMAEVKDVTGAFTGAYAIHPFTNERIPIWISDYVLIGYGTGAIMAVPAGDERDWDFARQFNLPVQAILEGQDASEGADERKDGRMINSGPIDGMRVAEATEWVISELEKRGIAVRKINYKLRDAVFSRQRYWGEPFPVYYRNGIPFTIDEDKLDQIRLPEIDNFKPTDTGAPPLGRATHWNWDREAGKIVENGKGYPMDLNTMPGWAGSNWYFLRYMMEGNAQERDAQFVSPEAVQYWGQVDLYMGGAEHATGHLLYFRFVTKFLYDRGFIPFDEPAKKLVNQGMIQGNTAFLSSLVAFDATGLPDGFDLSGVTIYLDATAAREALAEKRHHAFEKVLAQEYPLLDWSNTIIRPLEHAGKGIAKLRVPYTFVDMDTNAVDVGGFHQWSTTGDGLSGPFLVVGDAQGNCTCDWEVEKMSKSKWNVVTPEEVVGEHGADALRLHEMFLGPIEMHKPWNTKGIDGVSRFLRKLWRLYHPQAEAFEVSDEPASKEELKVLHKCIQKVTEDMERFSFNTSVSAFMIAVNELTDLKCHKREVLEPLAILISCHAPHMAEELWELLGHTTSITHAPWPAFDAALLIDNSFAYPVSFNGKTRFHHELPTNLSKEQIEQEVLASPQTEKWLEGKAPKKVIVVPGRIVNIVV